MKVFLYTLLRTVIFVGVSLLVYFIFGWGSWGLMGSILSVVVGAVVAFAVGYLFFDRQRRAAARQLADAVERRKAERPVGPTQAEKDAGVEDSYQDTQRREAGLTSDARTPRSVDPADDER